MTQWRFGSNLAAAKERTARTPMKDHQSRLNDDPLFTLYNFAVCPLAITFQRLP
jgi:hypothetical protein